MSDQENREGAEERVRGQQAVKRHLDEDDAEGQRSARQASTRTTPRARRKRHTLDEDDTEGQTKAHSMTTTPRAREAHMLDDDDTEGMRKRTPGLDEDDTEGMRKQAPGSPRTTASQL